MDRLWLADVVRCLVVAGDLSEVLLDWSGTLLVDARLCVSPQLDRATDGVCRFCCREPGDRETQAMCVHAEAWLWCVLVGLSVAAARRLVSDLMELATGGVCRFACRKAQGSRSLSFASFRFVWCARAGYSMLSPAM